GGGGGKEERGWVGAGGGVGVRGALRVEPSAPLGHRFDQAREERPHLEAVVEMHRRRRGTRSHQPHADRLAAVLERVDQLRRNVVGMNGDRHALPLGFDWRWAGGGWPQRAPCPRNSAGGPPAAFASVSVPV